MNHEVTFSRYKKKNYSSAPSLIGREWRWRYECSCGYGKGRFAKKEDAHKAYVLHVDAYCAAVALENAEKQLQVG